MSSPCRDNSILVGMMHNVAPFREMFGRYIFGGILDRHPSITVGWFEGGINWIPAAIQDAEHLYASLRHMADHDIDHEPSYYWHNNMYASFMVDPLGLELIDRIGVDRVMWSSGLPAQRVDVRLLRRVAAVAGRRRRTRGGREDRQHERAIVPRHMTAEEDEAWVLYAKDKATKIATITLNRPEALNAPTIGMRLRYAELLHRRQRR